MDKHKYKSNKKYEKEKELEREWRVYVVMVDGIKRALNASAGGGRLLRPRREETRHQRWIHHAQIRSYKTQIKHSIQFNYKLHSSSLRFKNRFGFY